MRFHRSLLMVVAALACVVHIPEWSSGQSSSLLAKSEVPERNVARRPDGARGWSLRQTPVVEVVRRVRGAVVNIHSERTARKPSLPSSTRAAEGSDPSLTLKATAKVNGMGTGVVIDPRGYVITNHHVVDNVLRLEVTLDGSINCNARVVARDREADLALLKVDAPTALPVVPLGTSSDLMVGETVVAIGNAYGYEHTVSVGVVSAVGRDVTLNREISYEALIQTDASINPGNSGGPLLNVHGELIGINVAIRQGAQGIGFAIPADTVVRVASSLLASRVHEGFVGKPGVDPGIELADRVLTPTGSSILPIHKVVPGASETQKISPPYLATGARREVLVRQVHRGGAAEHAHLHPGDVLEEVDGRAVSSSLDLYRALLGATPGNKLPVTIRRGGRRIPAMLTLQPSVRRTRSLDKDLIWDQLGLKVRLADRDDVARTHPELRGGLLVQELQTHGPASRGGIRKGDILIGLQGWAMTSPANVLFVLKHPTSRETSQSPPLGASSSPRPLRYVILRQGHVQRGWLHPGL